MMYIMTKLLSVANPEKNLQLAKDGKENAKIVLTFPINANAFAIHKTGKRPILSDNTPKTRVPKTDPMKKVDCPITGFQSSSHTQLN